MTVNDFIVVYNETFKYVEKNYGVDALKNLWGTISEQWCKHLDDLIRTKGLDGMLEYWGGTQGTLGREKADCEVSLNNGLFSIKMDECPSVGELWEKKRYIYNGELTYCDHCPALYHPIAEKYGYKMITEINHNEDGECAGSCRITAYKKEG